ncbi:hypothetical protein PMAYCL1PPCAC_26796, partial [Pristionchus mayeri]
QDNFSGLNNDCLLDVLSRVDHNDLDEISTVSEKMFGLSNSARSRAVKIEANQLQVPGLQQQCEISTRYLTIRLVNYHGNSIGTIYLSTMKTDLERARSDWSFKGSLEKSTFHPLTSTK